LQRLGLWGRNFIGLWWVRADVQLGRDERRPWPQVRGLQIVQRCDSSQGTQRPRWTEACSFVQGGIVVCASICIHAPFVCRIKERGPTPLLIIRQLTPQFSIAGSVRECDALGHSSKAGQYSRVEWWWAFGRC